MTTKNDNDETENSAERDTTPSTDFPVFEIDEITRVHLIFECPRCGDTHHHGNAYELEIGDTTARGAHCDDMHGEYLLKRTDRTQMYGGGV
jgi:hypothetical protein